MTFPLQLTILRIVLIPVFIITFYLPTPWNHEVTTVIFIIAALTDWFDGYLARRWQVTTAFGAFLDPVADKLLVATALILLLQTHTHLGFVLATLIIIGREIVISALREWMATCGQREQVAVSWLGKAKTMMQMIALTLLLYHQPILGWDIEQIGMICLYLAAFLTLWSMWVYLRAALPTLLSQSGKS
jgi:CDP-diacylglycerol--glycerol-3-phosphate 3-phosphatidyltransferase/cardiolipin synthase